MIRAATSEPKFLEQSQPLLRRDVSVSDKVHRAPRHRARGAKAGIDLTSAARLRMSTNAEGRRIGRATGCF